MVAPTLPVYQQQRGLAASTIIFVLVVIVGVIIWVSNSDVFKSDAWKQCVADGKNAFGNSQNVSTDTQNKIEQQCTEQHGG